MPTSKEVKPLASMEEAWGEYDCLRAASDACGTESDTLWAKGDALRAKGKALRAESVRVVTATAKALYGPHAIIDWQKRAVVNWDWEKQKEGINERSA